MNKMAAMPIYCKTPVEIFSRTGVTGWNFPPVSFFPGVKPGRPILSPGKKLTSQFFLPPVSFSPLCDFFIFSNINYSCLVKPYYLLLNTTRNWLQARLSVYPPQCADQNLVNLSKIIFSALNFFMHIFNMYVTTYLPCIKRIHWKL